MSGVIDMSFPFCEAGEGQWTLPSAHSRKTQKGDPAGPPICETRLYRGARLFVKFQPMPFQASAISPISARAARMSADPRLAKDASIRRRVSR